MNDGLDPLDDALRRTGSAFRESEAGWVPDTADVARRSRRQATTARRVTGAVMALVVVLLIGAGLGLTRGDNANDDDLTVAGMGTTTSSPGSTRPTTTSILVNPDRGSDGSTTTSTDDVAATTTTTPGPSTTRPGLGDASTGGADDQPSTPDEPTVATAPSPAVTTVPESETTTTTTTAPLHPPVPPGVELRDDGLGIVTLGDDGTATAAALVAAFGAPRFDTGWRVNPNVGLQRSIIWGPTGGTDPNANQALVVHLVDTGIPADTSDGFLRFTYCPTPGFPYLLRPGGVDPGPGCFDRSR
jgi:hypothetical protein